MPFSSFDRTDVWSAFQEEDIDLVIVLTEKQEYLVYAGMDLPAFYQSRGLESLHLPVPDFGIPEDLRDWDEALKAAIQAAQDGKNIAVHCLAGIGRTGIFMACLAKDVLGMEGEEAINWVRESVTGAMENKHQENFVINYRREEDK
ncbi:MAG: dual specificity protein phosphatase family protein [Anaerolineales bacterium]|nr:dual specificity protein phosphatase family protein [Anaerolineales bacterium]